MFSAKRPGEIVTLTFDFTAITASASSPVIAVFADSGLVDANPSAMLSGAPTINGAKVLQQVINGQAGTHYRFRCQILAADGLSVYVLEEVLPVL